jgi:PAS domain S-box-containing protein
MFFHRSNLGLPRRVVAYYLLFCLVAVAWLAIGVLFTSHCVLSSRGVNGCLSRIGKLTSSIELEHLRSGKANLQGIVARAKSEYRASYCAIESLDGTYLAHSNTQYVGQKLSDREGSHLHWGSLTGIRYTDESGVTLQEFRVPLLNDQHPFGSLRIAFSEPTMWSTLKEVASVAPIAILVPLALVGVGALVLSRITNSMSDITKQLQQLALDPDSLPTAISTVATKDPLTLGWNRLVTALQQASQATDQPTLEQKLQEATAARRQNQHAEILQTLSDGVAVTDVEGRITFANRAVATLLGAEIGEGGELQKFLSAEDIAERCQPLLDPQLASRPAVCEIPRSGALGERILRVSRQPVANGRIKGQVWSVRDVTQQKLSEKMRDQFIDTATHELRTPLSNIKAYAETMVTCDAIDIEEQKEFCNIINSEVTRLARFVDDLLSISSMEMGSICIEKQKVETARLFAEVLDKVEPLMQQKNITFFAELPEKMRELRLDKDKFIAVLVNLLGNAAKYTPTGGRVTMRVKIEDHELQVAVEDTGVGIAPDELPKVFEKFFRSADPRVQDETGTGLGLSLATEVVRMHGGEITVKSELNQGSTFTVTVPTE